MKGTARRATSTFSSGSHSLALIAVLKWMLLRTVIRARVHVQLSWFSRE